VLRASNPLVTVAILKLWAKRVKNLRIYASKVLLDADGNYSAFRLGKRRQSFSSTVLPKPSLFCKLHNDKYVRLRILTYIHTCRSYVHTPRELDRHVSHKSLEASHYNKGALSDSDFGLLGEQSSPKGEIRCLGRRWTALQNLTPLALSSAEKSVTVQTNRQTVNDISTSCLSACVDNNNSNKSRIYNV